jgi:hypothetical protein
MQGNRCFNVNKLKGNLKTAASPSSDHVDCFNILKSDLPRKMVIVQASVVTSETGTAHWYTLHLKKSPSKEGLKAL